jgi:hypothetical protein
MRRVSRYEIYWYCICIKPNGCQAFSFIVFIVEMATFLVT